MLLASVHSGVSPESLSRLERIVAQWANQPEHKDLAAYVSFRRLTAAYAAGLQDEKADPQQVQAERIKSLQAFVDSYPDSEDAPEAMLQLGVSEEFAGQVQKATDWYRKLAERFAKSAPAEKARGAILRLEPAGEPIAFRGSTLSGTSLDVKDYRGKLVLLHYWATWSPSSTAQVPALVELLKKHDSSGLAVIGINMNDRRDEASKYVAEQRIAWPQIHEPGGLDGPPANWFGIFTVPTLLLIDREGRVVKHGADLLEMEREIRTRIQGKNHERESFTICRRASQSASSGQSEHSCWPRQWSRPRVRRLQLRRRVILNLIDSPAAAADDDVGAADQPTEQVSPESLSRTFRAAALRVLPAIVEIRDASSESAIGSGILIDPSGMVLTNHHVVEEAQRPVVQLADGRRFVAKDVKSDPRSDLAILQFDSPAPLPVAHLGDSNRLQIGDWILTLGSPLDLRQTVSAGIISATGRKLEMAGDVRLVQTDAAINPGSSGGRWSISAGKWSA